MREIEVSSKGSVAGVGVESSDVVRMTDAMMRDMLATPELSNRASPPRVIVDAEYFVNDSSQAINKRAITNRLRVALNRASKGRMTFIARNYTQMVSHEMALRGQSGNPVATADLRLGGRIVSMDSRNRRTGEIQRYNQITFEMIDLNNETLVWSGIYEFQRAGADDIVYR
ncbi:MAG: penicillin-binding protein activator LpoB [Burkholderiaceae bacterium]